MTTTPSGTKFEAFNLAFDEGDIELSLNHLMQNLYDKAWELLLIDCPRSLKRVGSEVPVLGVLRGLLSKLIDSVERYPDRENLLFGTEIIQAIYSVKLALDGPIQGVKTLSDRRALLFIYGVTLGQMLAFSQLESSGHIAEHNKLVAKLFPIGKVKGAKLRGQQKMQSAHAWQSECEPKIINIAKRPSIKSRRMLIRLLRGDRTITNALPLDDRAIENFMKNLEEQGAMRSFGRAKK